MPLYSVKTKLSPEKAIQKAIDFFGEGGLGLEADAAEENACCAYFEGGGGHVRATAYAEAGKTVVDLETREWDRQVKQFMNEIA